MTAAARILPRWVLKRWPGSPLEAVKAENLGTRRPVPDLDADSKYLVRDIERSKMRSVARWCFENDGFTREAVGQLCRSVVGNDLRPMALSDDEAWNEAAEAEFRSRAAVIDVSKRFKLSALLKKWLTAHLVLGDIGVQKCRTKDGSPAVQTVMPHRIQNCGEFVDENLFDGVRVDDTTGAPTTYRVLVGSNPPVAVELPASDFILFADPDFADGYRGQCKLGAELLNVLDSKTILALEKQGVATNLSLALIDYREDSGNPDLLSGATPSTSQDGFTRDALTGSMILRRKIGDKVEAHQHNRPTPRLPDFLKELRAPVALSLGVSDQWVTGEYTANGTGIRGVIVKCSNRVKELQSLLSTSILENLWAWIIGDAIAAGRLPPNPKFTAVGWNWPPLPTVDNGRDSNAARSDLFAGLTTYAADYGERGEDWRDHLEQKAIEAAFIDEMAEKYGVSRDRIAAIGNNPQPATTTAAPTEDAQASKTGDKIDQ